MIPIKPEIAPIWGVPYTLYRYDRSDDDRYYFRFEGNTRHSYLSVTSFVSKSLGIGQTLADWMANVGKSHAKGYSQYRADYGTQMHIEIVEILRMGGGSFEDIVKRQIQICKDLGYGTHLTAWISEIRKDILSFLKFLQDKNVKVIFAELPVYSDKYGIAGSIDMGVEMDFNGGRVNALVDLKSGKKGFFEGHNLQLNIYKELWNDLFKTEFPVTHVFNWAPNAWRTSAKDPGEWPTYKLQNQTYTKYSVLKRLELALEEGMVLPPDSHMEIQGAFLLDAYSVGDHIKTYGIVENTELDSGEDEFFPGEEFEFPGD